MEVRTSTTGRMIAALFAFVFIGTLTLTLFMPEGATAWQSLGMVAGITVANIMADWIQGIK